MLGCGQQQRPTRTRSTTQHVVHPRTRVLGCAASSLSTAARSVMSTKEVVTRHLAGRKDLSSAWVPPGAWGDGKVGSAEVTAGLRQKGQRPGYGTVPWSAEQIGGVAGAEPAGQGR